MKTFTLTGLASINFLCGNVLLGTALLALAGVVAVVGMCTKQDDEE